MSTEMSVVFENSSCEIQEKTIGRNIMITIMKSITNKVGIVTLLTLIVGGLSLASANAAFVSKPSGATAFDSRADALPDYTVDGSGLSNDTIVKNGDPIPDPWPSHSTALGDTWTAAHGDNYDNVWIEFEMTEEVDLTGLHIWNQNETTDRGIDEVNVSFSTDGTNFVNEQTFNFDQAPGTSSYEGENYALNSTTSAKYVHFDVRSNHGSGSWVGLSEVRFTAVPEPGTLTLLVFGAGGLALTQRRRRRK